MKTLVYGIDGMSLEILKSISSGFREYVVGMNCYDIEDDILGRGWSKVFSGQKPQVTNAYFQMPVCDASFKIDQVYNLNTPGAQSDGRFEYLWEAADRLGLRSVFVNIPTAVPAPENGSAFVAGMGGGRYPKDGFDKDLYYPSDIESLIASKFKMDVRLDVTSDFDRFTAGLDEIHGSQTDFFVELCKEKDADFGFYVNKVTVEILFLSYYDITHIESSDEVVRNTIQNHFESIFNDFKRMLDELKPDRVILVSDHGTVGYKYDFNVDHLLNRLGFLHYEEDTVKDVMRCIFRSLPESLKMKIRKVKSVIKPPKKEKDIRKRSPLRTPAKGSLAFGTVVDTGNFCGVYLNDERFGGTVPPNNTELKERICKALNATSEFHAVGMQAVPYEDRNIDSPYSKGSPDIWIQKPDEVFCQRWKDTAFCVNKNYTSLTNDLTNHYYPNSGLKSSKALLAANFQSSTVPTNLCDAHTIIVEAMELGLEQ